MSPSDGDRRSPELTALGDSRYVALSSFRRSGERVVTAVWIARDGDGLVVITPAGSGKVKRVRANPRVELQRCSRMGRITGTEAPTPAVAEVLTDPARVTRLTGLLRRKYGLEYLIFTGLERITSRGRSQTAILRLTA